MGKTIERGMIIYLPLVPIVFNPPDGFCQVSTGSFPLGARSMDMFGSQEVMFGCSATKGKCFLSPQISTTKNKLMSQKVTFLHSRQDYFFS